MKKVILLCSVLFLSVPLLFAADKPSAAANQDEAKEKVQSLISQKVHLQKDGVQQLQTVSVNLSPESKEELYYANRKIGAFAWLNLVVPSVGSFIVGDKEGGIAGIVGNVIGIGGVVAGYALMLTSIASSSSSYYSGGYYYTLSLSGTAMAGAVIAVVGAVVMLGTDFLTVMGTYNYVNKFNANLQNGLNIEELSFNDVNPSYDRMKAQYACGLTPRANDLIHFEIARFAF